MKKVEASQAAMITAIYILNLILLHIDGKIRTSIPLVEGRRALRGAEAEPERLATRAWGMSGPVRIQEQNRTEFVIQADLAINFLGPSTAASARSNSF